MKVLRVQYCFLVCVGQYLSHLCAGNGIHVVILFYEHPSVDNPFPVSGCRCLNALQSCLLDLKIPVLVYEQML